MTPPPPPFLPEDVGLYNLKGLGGSMN